MLLRSASCVVISISALLVQCKAPMEHPLPPELVSGSRNEDTPKQENASDVSVSATTESEALHFDRPPDHIFFVTSSEPELALDGTEEILVKTLLPSLILVASGVGVAAVAKYRARKQAQGSVTEPKTALQQAPRLRRRFEKRLSDILEEVEPTASSRRATLDRPVETVERVPEDLPEADTAVVFQRRGRSQSVSDADALASPLARRRSVRSMSVGGQDFQVTVIRDALDVWTPPRVTSEALRAAADRLLKSENMKGLDPRDLTVLKRAVEEGSPSLRYELLTLYNKLEMGSPARGTLGRFLNVHFDFSGRPPLDGVANPPKMPKIPEVAFSELSAMAVAAKGIIGQPKSHTYMVESEPITITQINKAGEGGEGTLTRLSVEYQGEFFPLIMKREVKIDPETHARRKEIEDALVEDSFVTIYGRHYQEAAPHVAAPSVVLSTNYAYRGKKKAPRPKKTVSRSAPAQTDQPGGELYTFMEELRPLREGHELTPSQFAQLVTGLREMHGKGIFHLDIKRQNLMLDARGNLRIIDFGISTKEPRSYAANPEQVALSLYYLPPELLAIQKGAGLKGDTGDKSMYTAETDVGISNKAWDIYAAGVVAFELRYGVKVTDYYENGLAAAYGITKGDLLQRMTDHIENAAGGRGLLTPQDKQILSMIQIDPKKRVEQFDDPSLIP